MQWCISPAPSDQPLEAAVSACRESPSLKQECLQNVGGQDGNSTSLNHLAHSSSCPLSQQLQPAQTAGQRLRDCQGLAAELEQLIDGASEIIGRILHGRKGFLCPTRIPHLTTASVIWPA